MYRETKIHDVLLNPNSFIAETTLPGIYRAWCRSGNDPKYDDPQRIGRIKVFIPRIHLSLTPEGSSAMPEPDIDLLPWASPCLDIGGDSQYGDFKVPHYNATVWVMFENGERSQPVWMGSWWGSPGGVPETPTEALEPTITQKIQGISRYGNRRVIKSRAGHLIEIGDDEGELEISIKTADGNKLVLRDSPAHLENTRWARSPGIRLEDSSGSFIHLDPSQNRMSIFVVGNLDVSVVGDVLLQALKTKDGDGGNALLRTQGRIKTDSSE